jgi:hypothetical protein
LNGQHENRDPNDSLPREAGIPLLHGPTTAEEQAAIDQERQTRADKEADAAYKNRQIAVAEAANSLTRTNIRLTWVLAAFTAVTAGATLYQGYVSNKSANAARDAATASQQAADTADKSVLLGQKTERDGRLASEKQLVESARQFGENLKQTKSQTAQQVKSANTAAGQLNTMQQQLFLSERPWLAPEIIPTTPLILKTQAWTVYPYFDKSSPGIMQTSGSIGLKLLTHNSGNSPAIATLTKIILFKGWIGQGTIDDEKHSCEFKIPPEAGKTTLGYSVFPGNRPLEQESFGQLPISTSFDESNGFAIFAKVCIEYSTTFTGKTRIQMEEQFELQKKSGPDDPLLFKNDEEVPIDNLMFVHPFDVAAPGKTG